jgi:hypothetical protein
MLSREHLHMPATTSAVWHHVDVGLHAVCLGCHFAWPRCGDPTHHLPAAQVLDMRGVSVLSGSLPATYGNWTNLRELRYRAKSCCNLSQSCVVILHASPHMTG